MSRVLAAILVLPIRVIPKIRYHFAMRHAYYLFPFFLFIFSLHLSADEIAIRKILDSNLFEIKGGQKIRLAYIDAPSITNTNPKIRAIARAVKHFAKDELLNRSVEIEYIESMDAPEDIRPVRMWKKFPLQTVDYIKKYLENGFGKLAKEAGLSIEEAYLTAEQKAKRKQRGIWNPNLYKPSPPQIYTATLLMGINSDEGEDSPPVKELLLNTRLLTHNGGFGVRLASAYGQYTQEYSEPQNGTLYYIINFYGIITGKYIEFQPGLFYINIPYERRYRNFALPNARLKIGDLKKFYLSLDFLTDFYSPFSIGVNLESNYNYYYKLWIGVTPLSYISSEERWMAAIKSELGISKRLLLNVQAIQINDRYDPTRYGFRVGIGYNFSVGR